MSKTMTDMCLSERKVDLTFRLYVDPGDEDYISARWAYSNGLFHIFYWCAAQACEKYMKAFVLLQDQSVSKFGHDLVRLFQAVKSYDPNGEIPEHLDLPETSAMGREAWQDKPLTLYVDYLNIYGSSDNRYAFHGTFVNGPVLHALDIFCHSMRRIIRKTNLTKKDLFEFQNALSMPHEMIADSQDWMIDPKLLLERMFVNRYQVGQNSELRSIFLNMNFAFSNARAETERSFGGQSFHGSPLHNHLVRLAEIEPTPENKDAVDQLRIWALKNIHMSSRVQTDLGYTPQKKQPQNQQ